MDRIRIGRGLSPAGSSIRNRPADSTHEEPGRRIENVDNAGAKRHLQDLQGIPGRLPIAHQAPRRADPLTIRGNRKHVIARGQEADAPGQPRRPHADPGMVVNVAGEWVQALDLVSLPPAGELIAQLPPPGPVLSDLVECLQVLFVLEMRQQKQQTIHQDLLFRITGRAIVERFKSLKVDSLKRLFALEDLSAEVNELIQLAGLFIVAQKGDKQNAGSPWNPDWDRQLVAASFP